MASAKKMKKRISASLAWQRDISWRRNGVKAAALAISRGLSKAGISSIMT